MLRMATATQQKPTLQESKKIVQEGIIQRRGQFSVSVKAEPHQEHIKIRGVRIDLFASNIHNIEEKTGFHLHGITYWNEPDFCDRYPDMPKYMRDYTAGNHVEIRFVRVKSEREVNRA